MSELIISDVYRYILETKRPTNNPAQNHAFITNLLDYLNIPYNYDINNNTWVDVGVSDTCFTAHTDTVDKCLGKNNLGFLTDKTKTQWVSVQGNTNILGADCGSGMYILIEMIRAEVPGHYVFFATEEQGRIGSMKYDMPRNIVRVISFDRKDEDNLITHQMGERGCSDKFADTFIKHFELPYKKDPTGAFTDSYSFFNSVPECINLSVGYYDQHSKFECQNLTFLDKLIDACIVLPWEELPAERDPTVQEFDSWNDPYYSGYYSNAYNTSRYYPSDIKKLRKLCQNYPEVAAELLDTYGVTASDFEDEVDYQYPPFKKK